MDRGDLRPIERGQCLMHGYVISRCCPLFEPRRAKPFLRPAIARARSAAMRALPQTKEREQ